MKKIDMLLICDYGHNFISKNIANEIMKKQKNDLFKCPN